MAEREIRLGLVCFGGVSLAVYMAGITREIQILAEASRALDTPAERSLTGTAKEYAAALRRRAERDGVLTRVVVDVIAGTSAGGIDGIFLAKGLATGVDQAPLRDIWMEQGDLRRLVRGRGPLLLRGLTFLARAAAPGGAAAPLDGDLLLRHAYRGLRAMNPPGASAGASPAGPDGTLDLFVTVTDVKGRKRSVSVWEGDRPVHDRTHRYVLGLTAPLPRGPAGSQPGGFTAVYDGALAFAARATSSFPGAFPQVRLADVHAVLAQEGGADVDQQMATLRRELFDSYGAEGEDPEDSWFFDGGVLDNFPFEHAISAIQRKPAGTEVERYLVVLQPDPGPPTESDVAERADTVAQAPTRRPGWLATILAGFVGVRMPEPILDDLIRLRAANERLDQVADHVERLEHRVQKRLTEVGCHVSPVSDYDAVQQATQAMHDVSVSAAGMAWPHYLDLRLDAVTSVLCEATTAALHYPGESRQAAHVRAVLRRMVVGTRDAGEPELNDFLRRYDLPFRERRLRLAVQMVNAEYAGTVVPRELLDATKESLYDSLRRLWAIPADVGRAVGTPGVLGPGTLRGWLERDLDDPLAEHGAELREWMAKVGAALDHALDGFGKRSWDDLAARLRPWDTDRAAVVVRTFVGFPLWDISVFPLLATSQVQQFTPVRTRHISPVEATKLRGSRDKLRGIPMHHFAAFLDRESRENDYAWGRLDAAECLLRMVDDQTTDAEYAAGFEAVINQESDLGVLDPRRGDGLRADLEGWLSGLRGSSVPGAPEA